MVKLRKLAGLGFGVLCLSTAMFMSSCSKEDAAAPQPKLEIAKSDANMKTSQVVPFIEQTNGSVLGPNIFPMGWDAWYKNDPVPLYAAIGTSSFTNLCGRADTKWLLPLPQLPVVGAFVSTSSLFLPGAQYGRINPVVGKIHNLKPSKKYSITFQISTANTLLSKYAKTAVVKIHDTALPNSLVEVSYDLSNARNKWITRTIQFVSQTASAELEFYVKADPALGLSFGNIHVGPNALKQLD